MNGQSLAFTLDVILNAYVNYLNGKKAKFIILQKILQNAQYFSKQKKNITNSKHYKNMLSFLFTYLLIYLTGCRCIYQFKIINLHLIQYWIQKYMADLQKAVNKKQVASTQYNLITGLKIQKQNQNGSKFLKRKQDSKKNLLGCTSKKKRQASNNEYIGLKVQNGEDMSITDLLLAPSYIPIREKESIQHSRVQSESYRLQTAKSQGSLTLRKRELGAVIKRVHENENKIIRDELGSKKTKQSKTNAEQNMFGDSKNIEKSFYNQLKLESQLKIETKKSKTQFFDFELFVSPIVPTKFKKNEEASSSPEDISQSYEILKCDYELANSKQKWLQEQLQSSAQRQYLLQTQRAHLRELIKQKDLIISNLQDEKRFLTEKTHIDVNRQLKKYQRQICELRSSLAKEEVRIQHLKEESDYIQNELIAKNEELITVYSQYSHLQAKHRRYEQKMMIRFDKLRGQLEARKQKERVEINDYGYLNQAQRWKEKYMKLQQEMKYVQIQNQCLMISKDQLLKYKNENRMLRDERDYFKTKVIQNMNKNRKIGDLSRSSNSSIVLELSDLSGQKLLK